MFLTSQQNFGEIRGRPAERSVTAQALTPDLLGEVTQFIDLTHVAKFQVATRRLDDALRAPGTRRSVLAHLDGGRVAADASLEHAALRAATRRWAPLAGKGNAEATNWLVRTDPKGVDARCAEIACLLKRHVGWTARVEGHAGRDVAPPVVAHALAAARARWVADRVADRLACLGVARDRVTLALMRPRSPETRVEVYLRNGDVEVPDRPSDGAPPHGPPLLLPRAWRRPRRAWPLSRLARIAGSWLGRDIV